MTFIYTWVTRLLASVGTVAMLLSVGYLYGHHKAAEAGKLALAAQAAAYNAAADTVRQVAEQQKTAMDAAGNKAADAVQQSIKQTTTTQQRAEEQIKREKDTCADRPVPAGILDGLRQ